MPRLVPPLMASNDYFNRLRDLLASVLPREAERPDARRRAFAMLFSLVVATVLWFSVSMDESYNLGVDLPIEVRRLPDGQALRSPPRSPVRVTVQGRGWDLLALSRNPPVLTVDAEEDRINLLSAASEMGRLPTGVQVQSIAPTVLPLDLDEEVEKRVPVQLRGALELDADHEYLESPNMQPDSVRVVGARTILRDLVAWPTVPVDMDDLDASFEIQVALEDTLAGLVEIDRTQTRLAVRVDRFTQATRELVVQVVGVPPGVQAVRLLPSRVTATYRVPVNDALFAQAQTTDEFFAFVPYANIARDTTGTVSPFPQLPADLPIRDVSLEPSRLRYYTVVE
ncbi:MAG: YbbR-like domain-containing protein [Bacteroidota bacterium]